MIRRCDDRDFELIWTIINDGAQVYRGTYSRRSLDRALHVQRKTCSTKSMRVLCSGATRITECSRA